MKQIINQFINTLSLELHPMHPIVAKYSGCGPGTKHKDRIEKYSETGHVTSLYKNILLDAAYFEHYGWYTKFKDTACRLQYDQKLIQDIE